MLGARVGESPGKAKSEDVPAGIQPLIRRPDGVVSGEDQEFTAVCVSIDRFQQDTAPVRCLRFDGIGVRHPGMTHDAAARSLEHALFAGIILLRKIDSMYLPRIERVC